MDTQPQSNPTGSTHRETRDAAKQRRRRRRLAGGFAALVLGLAAIPVWARYGAHHGWHGDGEFIEFVIERKLRKIDASEEQREQILGVAAETREALLALRDGLPDAHDAFVEQLVSDPAARDELDSLRAAQITRMEEGSRILVEGIARIGEILSLEQREQLAAMHEERRGRWKH